MSFLTPPPEFEDCLDASTLLTDNHCAIRDIFYPSPSSVRSDYSPHSPTCSDHLYIEQDRSQSQLFTDNNPGLHFDPLMTATQSQGMYGIEPSFGMYDHSTWSHHQSMPPQYPPLPSGHEETPSFFGGYYQSESSIPSMLPPTPQPVTPNGYNFGSPIRTGESVPYIHSLHQRPIFTPDASMSISSRSPSPNLSHDPSTRKRSHTHTTASASSPLSHYGIPVRAPGSLANSAPQAWRCAYPNCTSRATFIRGCDLRKHYNRHSKHLFCRVAGCPQSEQAAVTAAQVQDPTCQDPSQLILSGGFSSKKDRARHEAKHNPGIKCEWQGPDGEECGRLFSRMDNMKDHVRRIHNKGQVSAPTSSIPSQDKNRRLKRNSR